MRKTFQRGIIDDDLDFIDYDGIFVFKSIPSVSHGKWAKTLLNGVHFNHLIVGLARIGRCKPYPRSKLGVGTTKGAFPYNSYRYI